MRYKVGGVEIRSENAAKPKEQASRYLVEWLERQGPLGRVLDFGCGKLRYAGVLIGNSDHAVLVDSEIQLSRQQVLGGRVTTVREYVRRKWRRARVMSYDDYRRDRSLRFDFVLCANVLSAIPDKGVLAGVLPSFRRRMQKEGRCLIVTQYRNSDFERMRQSPTASPYLHGWIIRSLRGSAYYGILKGSAVVRMIRAARMKVIHSWTHDGSALVLCGK